MVRLEVFRFKVARASGAFFFKAQRGCPGTPSQPLALAPQGISQEKRDVGTLVGWRLEYGVGLFPKP